MSDNEPNRPHNSARRHFLGLAAATSARLAAMGMLASAIFPPSMALAKGKKWWKHDGKPGGNSGGHGQSGGSPMCFLRGTSIMTSTGEVCIEDLQIGDLVETVRGEAMAVKWIGRRVFKHSGPAWSNSVMPIRVARHALDDRTPHRDLYLSPGHALFIDGVLIRAKELVNGISIAPGLPADRETIEYFHIVLDSHDVVLAEGAPAESFLLQMRNYEDFTNFGEFARLYPDAANSAMTPYAPIVSLSSGREHMKALLHLWTDVVYPRRAPAYNAYERIAARAGKLIG